MVQVLSKFEFPTRDDVVLGPETLDDAGAIDIGDGRLMIQTVDFFPPIVDDPYEYGMIAAANALSDIYAMGAEPVSVLNVVGFPRDKLDMEILGTILAGGAEKIREAGAALLGGHTVEDNEIKYGLSVTGFVERDRLWTNGGAQAGDVLILTKPLGMGALSTSGQSGKGDPEWMAAAIRSMATLNAAGARALREHEVHSVTDVTGFGLLGHASETSRAAGVVLRFEAAKLPFTPGAIELSRKGTLSGGTRRNRAYLGEHAQIGAGVAPEIAALAFDSETSGGLLAAVPPAAVDGVLASLREAGTPCAEVVGEVQPADGDTWVRLD